jgi:hypothetical protein
VNPQRHFMPLTAVNVVSEILQSLRHDIADHNYIILISVLQICFCQRTINLELFKKGQIIDV